MDAHRFDDCAGCEWERQPQAFRWFPELGVPLRAARAQVPGPAGDGQTPVISPAVRVRAVSNRAAQSAQLTTFHHALT